MTKIVGIGGSLRPHSLAYRILNLALKKVAEAGVAVELIDLRQLHLPFCTGASSYPDYPDVDLLRSLIGSADGIVFSTPEYHGAMSGVLKNAIDLLEEEQLTGKVVGLMAVAGGASSTGALNTMRLVCRHLHCWVLPDQLVIPYSEESFNEQGELKESELERRLEKMIEHLIVAVRKLS